MLSVKSQNSLSKVVLLQWLLTREEKPRGSRRLLRWGRRALAYLSNSAQGGVGSVLEERKPYLLACCCAIYNLDFNYYFRVLKTCLEAL